jgi:DNA-binding NtrC family response regulator
MHLPPLRERLDDLPDLVDTLLRKVMQRSSRSGCSLTDEAAACLLTYPWPGNVRELENALEHACAVGESAEIGVGDLPEIIRRYTADVPLATSHNIRPLWQVERDYILSTLRMCQGNKQRTARVLRIAPDTLYRKLKQYRESA